MTNNDLSLAPAESNGKKFRAQVKRILMEYGYQQAESSEFKELMRRKQNVFVQKYRIGDSIYGTSRTVDFFLYHPDKWPEFLAIQCRFQIESGTVDQKFPYEVDCIKMDEVATIILLEGGGWRPEAMRWLENKAQTVKWLYVVVSREELCQMI